MTYLAEINQNYDSLHQQQENEDSQIDEEDKLIGKRENELTMDRYL